MFEKIPMITIEMPTPLVHANYQKRLSVLPCTIHEESMHAFDASFTLSGKDFQALLPLPSVRFVSERYGYIQTFIVLDADSRYYTERQDYDSYMLLYTYKGEGELVYEDETFSIGPGEGFFIDCRKKHRYQTVGKHWHHCVLHFRGGKSEYIYQEFQSEGLVKFSYPFLEEYQDLLEDLLNCYSTLSRHREYYVSNAISTLLCSILQKAEKETNGIPEVYRYLLKYLESNYQKDLSLEHLAEFAGISKYHLSREFKKYTGFSPNDYVIELRITHAKILLSNTEIPSYKIGQMVGIPNETNFSRLFKKRTGMTPGKFRMSKTL